MDASIALIIQGAIGLLGILILLVFINGILSPSKTEKYRRTLVDMYISGVVRKLAKEESIDLDEEYKSFIKQSKKKEILNKGLDEVIEKEKAEAFIEEKEKATKK